jgi:hypothetical protein
MSGKKLGLDKLYKNLYTTVNKNSPSTEFMNRRLKLSTPTDDTIRKAAKSVFEKDTFKNRRLKLNTPTSDTIKKAAKSVFRRSPIGRIADLTIKVGSGIGMGYEIAKNKFKTDKKSTGGETKLSPKQQKIAAAAPPPNKITGEDFAALKKNKDVKKA